MQKETQGEDPTLVNWRNPVFFLKPTTSSGADLERYIDSCN